MATQNAINANSAGLVRYDGAGTFTGVTVTQHAVLVGAASNGITSIGPLTNGQVVIGSSGVDPVAATLTAGSGISITNGAGSITIAGAGGGLAWTVVTGTTQSAAVNNGYIANNAGTVTITLPATSAVGSIVAVTGINNATGWQIAQNAGNQIFFGISSTTSGTGGYLASTNIYDSVYLVCTTANANWTVLNSVGNITVH
jgi:hypothetical protein